MRRLSRMVDGWLWPILLTGGGTAVAMLAQWQPWEIVALAAVLGVAGAALAAVAAWYDLRTRAINLAAITSDEQAARLLGEALGQCGTHLPEQTSKEIWDTFANAPSDSKRAMTLAITGFIEQLDSLELMFAGPKLLSLAHGFRTPKPPISSDEEAARLFGEAVGRCANYLDDKATQEVWDVFTALPPSEKRGFASVLAGFVSSVDFDLEPGEKILALARSFRAVSEHSPALTP